jgi:glycosyltransferase involved in cell wall biosynthesis
MPSNHPQVSILLPVYNHAAYLGEAIQSALDQTFGDLELIIVNDESPDESEAVVKRFDDRRIRYIAQKNKGVPGALNTAFAAASGDYIALLNDDDRWLPDKLQGQVGILERDAEVGVVYGIAQVIDHAGQPRPHSIGIPGKYPGDMLKSLLYENCLCPATVIIRRTCLERTGPWDEALPGSDDRDMWLRLARHCRFHFQNQVVAEYRVHASNYSAGRFAHFEAYQNRRLQVLDKFYAAPDCPPNALAVKPLAYRNLHTAIGMQWAGNGNWRKVGWHFGQAFKAQPSPANALRIGGILATHWIGRSTLGKKLLARYVQWRLKGRMPTP